MNNVFCSDCGTSIEGEPPIPEDPAQRVPCPKCGATARNVSMGAQAGIIGLTMGAHLRVTRYSETLLTKSQELISRGEFSIAVVVAHMACEIGAERAISRAFSGRGIEFLEDAVSAFLPGYNLANRRNRDLYNALTGREIQKEAFWPAFKESAERRNRTVHRGAVVTEAEAKASYEAAKSLVDYLN
jgi:hypothetical protein